MLPIVLLCAGEANRLRPITNDIPKCLIPINGRPFLFWQLLLLKKRGFSHVVITSGYKQEKIEKFLNNNKFSMKIDLLYHNLLPNTGGGTKRASALFKDSFFVMYGDSYLPYLDFKEVESTFLKNKKNGLITIYKNNNQFDSSNILYLEEKKQIIKYEKNSCDKNFEYIDYGVSVFNQQAIEYTKNIDCFDLSFLHKKLIQEDQLFPYICKDRFYEVGSLNGIKEFTDYIKDKNS